MLDPTRKPRGSQARRPPTVEAMSRKKREAPVSYRPPTKLRDEFHARIANSGLSANAFITASVFGQAAPRARPTPKLDRQMAATLLSQAARINDRLLGQPSGVPDAHATLLQECRDELVEIRTCLMHVLGRDP
jgi:hypothetical protein